MQIQIDITGVAIDDQFNVGSKISDLHNIGIVPDAIDGGRSLHVSNWNGSRVVVSDYQTDEVIVSGNGWNNAMQALADHYGIPVQVSRDPGVTGGKSGKVLGLWSPATSAAPRRPGMVAEDARPGMLMASQSDEGVWYEIGGVMLRGDKVSITLIEGGRAWTTDYALDAPVTLVDPATVKLTKAQAATLRLAAEENLHHSPSNVDWAPRHAWRGRVFTGRPKRYGFKSDIHTESANALDKLGMLNVPAQRGFARPSGAGSAWLAAHPA